MAIHLQQERAALDWFEEHRDEYLSALVHARESGKQQQVVELAGTLAPVLQRRSNRQSARASRSLDGVWRLLQNSAI